MVGLKTSEEPVVLNSMFRIRNVGLLAFNILRCLAGNTATSKGVNFASVANRPSRT
jgi:hypothetical protein